MITLLRQNKLKTVNAHGDGGHIQESPLPPQFESVKVNWCQ